MTAPADDSLRVEALLAEVLERPEEEWEAALAAACAAHPELAEVLRRRFARLKDTALVAASPADRIPERLAHFKLLRRLGGGGMGVVYLALDEELGRQVALKLVRPEHLFFPGARQRFRREVEATARLRHPSIVPLFTFGEAEGLPWFTMEWVPGLTLAEVLERLVAQGASPARLAGSDVAPLFEGLLDSPPVAEPERTFGRSWVEFCLRAVHQAAVALAHAHGQGVLHRDVKPSNLMLTSDGRVRVLDFGLSLSEGASRLTRTGGTMGSLPYMAPEQLRSKAADARTDVYALGVTLWELLTLRCPFLSADGEETRRNILHGSPAPPSSHNTAVAWEVDTVCLKAMDADPAQRYATMAELFEDLRNVLELRPIQAKRPGALRRARRYVQRHPTRTAVLGLGTLLVVFGPLALWLQQRGHARELGQALADVERLADEVVVRDLVEEADRLWPATPERVPQMQAWLDRARDVEERARVHREALVRLRQQAQPWSVEDRAKDAERRAQIERQLAVYRESLDKLLATGPSAEASREVGFTRDKIGALEAERADRYTWRFARPAQGWQHERLLRLLEEIDRLGPIAAALRQRLAFARDVDRLSIEAHRAAWDRVIAEIAERAANPAYRGLRLRPQRGLVPLGRDRASKLFEFAHLQTGEPPGRSGRGRLRVTEASGLVFVLLPGGRCRLGARRPGPGETHGEPNVDQQALPPEAPVHEVDLLPFFLSKYEMTQAQWLRLEGSNPSEAAPDHSPTGETITLLHPVENVDWIDAEAAMIRLGLLLPTEAQWEYAARGGTTTPWFTGVDGESLEGYANVRDLGYKALHDGFQDCAPFTDGWIVHGPVHAFEPNPFGLHSMLGNVSEHCRDTWMSYDALPGQAGDGLRQVVTERTAVFRGGSYMDPLRIVRVSQRGTHGRQEASTFCGIRPSRRLEE